MCRITFSPNIVQQARIATDGVLGDFIVRYDVQRDMGIGDIQVSLGGELSACPSPHSHFLSSVSGLKWTLCPLLRPQRPAGGPQERGVRHRHQRLHAGQEDPPGKSLLARLLAWRLAGALLPDAPPGASTVDSGPLVKSPPSGGAAAAALEAGSGLRSSSRPLRGWKVSLHAVMEQHPRPLILSQHQRPPPPSHTGPQEQTSECAGTQQTLQMSAVVCCGEWAEPSALP